MSTYPSQQYFHPCILPLERAFIIGHRGELLALCDTYVNVHSLSEVWSPQLPTHLPLLSFQHVASLLQGGTKCEFARKTRIQPLYKAREGYRIIVFRQSLWCWGNQQRFSSLLSPCSAPGSCVTMYHPGLLLFQGTSVSEIGKLLYQSPVLARMLHSVSSCC